MTTNQQSIDEKPCFPDRRPKDHFKLGDAVVCFIPENLEKVLKPNSFALGEVFARRPGEIIARTYEQIHTDDLYDGHGFHCRLFRPEIMLEWEYEYLKTHPEYLEDWIGGNPHLTESRSNAMIEAFKAT